MFSLLGRRCGPNHLSTNLSPLLSFFLYLPENLSELNAPISQPNDRIKCLVCEGPVCHTSGIICAIFGYRRGHWSPCLGAWQARSYKAKDRRFPIALVPRERPYDPMDEDDTDDGFELTPERLEDLHSEYLCARGGDLLTCPFQCDICQFRNMTSRNPGVGLADDETLVCIRRATLDAFWA